MEFDPHALARLRAIRALSLNELAESVGMTKGAIWRLESGVTKRPHPGSLRKLAAVLGVEPCALLIDGQQETAGEFDRHALTRLRDSRNLGHSELEKRAGIGQGIVWKLEKGFTRSPRLSTLHKLADALDVEPAALLVKKTPATD